MTGPVYQMFTDYYSWDRQHNDYLNLQVKRRWGWCVFYWLEGYLSDVPGLSWSDFRSSDGPIFGHVFALEVISVREVTP